MGVAQRSMPMDPSSLYGQGIIQQKPGLGGAGSFPLYSNFLFRVKTIGKKCIAVSNFLSLCLCHRVAATEVLDGILCIFFYA